MLTPTDTHLIQALPPAVFLIGISLPNSSTRLTLSTYDCSNTNCDTIIVLVSVISCHACDNHFVYLLITEMNTQELIQRDEPPTIFDLKMSSRDIAEETCKEHAHVLRDIRSLISNHVLDQSNYGEISLPDTYGRMQPAYLLEFDATMVLITGYAAHQGRTKDD